MVPSLPPLPSLSVAAEHCTHWTRLLTAEAVLTAVYPLSERKREKYNCSEERERSIYKFVVGNERLLCIYICIDYSSQWLWPYGVYIQYILYRPLFKPISI